MTDHPDVFAPVSIPGDGSRYWYSVNVELPNEVAAEYDWYAAQAEGVRTIEIHGALYLYRNSEMTPEECRNEFKALIHAGIDSGPGIEVTDEFWEQFKRDAEARHQKLLRLEEEGKLGNLRLPEELYEFISKKIRDGVHASPTDVVVAALPYLRADNSSGENR